MCRFFHGFLYKIDKIYYNYFINNKNIIIYIKMLNENTNSTSSETDYSVEEEMFEETNDSGSVTDTDSISDSYSYSSDDESSVIIQTANDYNHYSYIDDEIEYRLERIFREESEFIDTDKENGKYCIGLHKYNSYRKILILSNTVSTKSFLKFPYMDTLRYLYFYSILRPPIPKINIYSLSVLPDGTYSVILKTHWLRIIQRNWKKIFKERSEILLKRRSVQSLYNLQISGRYPAGLNSMPSIHGMLWNLNKKYILYKNKNRNTYETDIIIDMEIQELPLFIKSQ
uniref:Uncharacterized protein n=1 Tax=viral metagenome TaxID=1070528 RepID=A0A6C0DLI6_9ZZZZ